MKNVWIYISTFLAGLASGLVVMYKLMGDQVSIVVRKVKNKRTSGTNSVTVPIDIETAKLSRKQRKKERKAIKNENKLARKQRRLNKKF